MVLMSSGVTHMVQGSTRNMKMCVGKDVKHIVFGKLACRYRIVEVTPVLGRARKFVMSPLWDNG